MHGKKTINLGFVYFSSLTIEIPNIKQWITVEQTEIRYIPLGMPFEMPNWIPFFCLGMPCIRMTPRQPTDFSQEDSRKLPLCSWELAAPARHRPHKRNLRGPVEMNKMQKWVKTIGSLGLGLISFLKCWLKAPGF